MKKVISVFLSVLLAFALPQSVFATNQTENNVEMVEGETVLSDIQPLKNEKYSFILHFSSQSKDMEAKVNCRWLYFEGSSMASYKKMIAEAESPSIRILKLGISTVNDMFLPDCILSEGQIILKVAFQEMDNDTKIYYANTVLELSKYPALNEMVESCKQTVSDETAEENQELLSTETWATQYAQPVMCSAQNMVASGEIRDFLYQEYGINRLSGAGDRYGLEAILGNTAFTTEGQIIKLVKGSGDNDTLYVVKKVRDPKSKEITSLGAKYELKKILEYNTAITFEMTCALNFMVTYKQADGSRDFYYSESGYYVSAKNVQLAIAMGGPLNQGYLKSCTFDHCEGKGEAYSPLKEALGLVAGEVAEKVMGDYAIVGDIFSLSSTTIANKNKKERLQNFQLPGENMSEKTRAIGSTYHGTPFISQLSHLRLSAVADLNESGASFIQFQALANFSWPSITLSGPVIEVPWDYSDNIYVDRQAPFINSNYNGCYVNKTVKAALDVAESDLDDKTPGKNVWLYSYHGLENQQWTFKHIEDGYYRISPVYAPDLSLTLNDAGFLMVETYTGRNAQRWRINRTLDGGIALITCHSKYYYQPIIPWSTNRIPENLIAYGVLPKDHVNKNNAYSWEKVN